MKLLEKYLHAFKKLRRAATNGGAPHKPVLLLAVLEGVARGEIVSNRIAITPELILCFKEYWSKLVVTQHKMNFALPFYHMRTEPFWKLVCKPGYEIALTSSHSIKSLSALNDALLWAEIDEALFLLMNDAVTNALLKQHLLDLYFPNAHHVAVDYTSLHNIEKEILHEEHSNYQQHISSLLKTLSKEEAEEELFVRGSLFKREVPKQYNYTCAISRMQVVSVSNVQMVDACHIVPFSISNDDTIKNGISLSPTLHRAFDRGLISISEDYKVMVSPLVRDDRSAAALTYYDGHPILTPTHTAYLPSQDNLAWHRGEVFLGGVHLDKLM